MNLKTRTNQPVTDENGNDIIEVIANEVKPILDTHYVKILPAPESTTLTDEQIDMIKGGTFVEGEFIGFKNPVLLPPRETEEYLVGIIMGDFESGSVNAITTYRITKATKVIQASSGSFNIAQLSYVNGKRIPDYPASTGTFVLKSVDGVLTWVEEV